MQIIIFVDRIWCCRLQLTLFLGRPMCRHLNSRGISERPVGVHEFGITFHVRNPNSPCGDCKAQMHYTSHIRHLIVPKDCGCPIITSLSRDPGLNPGIWGASPTLYALR